jgi:type VI secretion system secreted protein VgrG
MGELMAIAQQHRRIAISTPLGKDVLLLRGFSGSEAISQLFHFDLDLLSENDSIKFQDVVGKSVTLRIYDAAGAERHWNGFVSRFSQGGQDRRLTAYRAQMVPWLWFLTRTADCRIFQNQKAPDIIQKIFKDLGFADFKLRLYGDFVTRDYCVQYRETDFNFVSRLMEEEGICYYFEHSDGKHTLILANDASAHDPCPNQKTARYDFRGGSVVYEDVVTEWQYQEEFRPGKWAQTDYNFETPSSSLAVTASGKNSYEIYEYPGEYRVRPAGESLAKIRLQEQTTPAIVFPGASGCRYFSPGYQFTLQDHYRSDLNQAYLLTAVRHMASQGGSYQVGGGGGEEPTYHNSFECIPFSTPYRPARVTPEPFVQGCQTAVVVGPAGEEIYTDKYGRVKVQFHWDREGKKNENSSCWIRVSHPWAGQGWGAISIPRIGQEVIVDFLEGDPDQPIITGRVYNAGQMPPFGMPAGAVVSGVKSNSTKGGGGFNEISLNDTKGTELINIHGQYDMQTKVEHDQRLNVVNNRTKNVGVDESTTVGNNRTEHVGANEKITIDANRTETVGANETINITANRTETVGSNESLSVALTRTHSVGINEMINIGAAQEVTIGGLQMLSVGAIRTLHVGLSQSTSIGTSLKQKIGTSLSQTVGTSATYEVGSSLSQKVGSDHTVKVGSKRSVDVGSDDSLKVGGKLVIDAGSEIVLKTGSASITMKSGGDIVIKGQKITIDGSAKISQKAPTISSEAQSKHTTKGAMVNVEADGIATIKGGLVKIN